MLNNDTIASKTYQKDKQQKYKKIIKLNQVQDLFYF